MTDWTPKLIQDLVDLWATGESASAIGRKLGVSKNAVVGKAHRLQLPSRKSPIIRTGRPKPVRGLPQLEIPEVEIEPELIELFPPERQAQTCEWPFEGACDAPRLHRRPYCAKHCAIAYVPRAA